MYNFR